MCDALLPHPSGNSLIWLLKLYNILVFLLFPQQHNTLNATLSQNILDQASKISYCRASLEYSSCRPEQVHNSTPPPPPQETALLVFPAHPGPWLWLWLWRKQTRAGEDRAGAFPGHLDRKLIRVVTFLARVVCLRLEINILHGAVSLLCWGRGCGGAEPPLPQQRA